MKICTAEKLTAFDRAICRAFSFKLQTNLTDKGFAKAPLAFSTEPELPTVSRIRSRVAYLAGFKPHRYDCCVNSCILYVGPHSDLTVCPHCNEDRYHSNGNPRKHFTYIPLIPRLVASYADPKQAELMAYRADHERNRQPHVTTDVFDGTEYQDLRQKCVEINGEESLGHKFFADDRDIALGLSTDGFAPFKRRKNTAWPLIVFNFNLPPDKRFHMDEILALGVIPGPKKPTDIDSFLWPALLEFLELAKGVLAFDILSRVLFALRAYLILIFGDIPAISMIMHMKGHNGFSPCRMCEIVGLRVPGVQSTTHYVPHFRSNHPQVLADPNAIRVYDMANLPSRTHTRFMAQATEVQLATTTAESDRLSKKYGIKGVPILSHLPSLSFPSSFPYDFMHLIWENLVKNLVLHWTGEFKGLDDGRESYSFSKAVWEAIGAASAASGSTIPSAYGVRVPNIAIESANISAEMWSFWTLYLGPIFLRRRFQRNKYFDHFVLLVRLLNLCLQFEISTSEIEEIRSGFIKWVTEYEK